MRLIGTPPAPFENRALRRCHSSAGRRVVERILGDEHGAHEALVGRHRAHVHAPSYGLKVRLKVRVGPAARPAPVVLRLAERVHEVVQLSAAAEALPTWDHLLLLEERGLTIILTFLRLLVLSAGVVVK